MLPHCRHCLHKPLLHGLRQQLLHVVVPHEELTLVRGIPLCGMWGDPCRVLHVPPRGSGTEIWGGGRGEASPGEGMMEMMSRWAAVS